jgi:cytochrome c oxidase subunit 4
MAEVEAPTGEWKSIVGMVLVLISTGIWGYLWMKKVVYGELPDTITNMEKQKAQIDRMIAVRANPIEGIASKYDYEKGRWK